MHRRDFSDTKECRCLSYLTCSTHSPPTPPCACAPKLRGFQSLCPSESQRLDARNRVSENGGDNSGNACGQGNLAGHHGVVDESTPRHFRSLAEALMCSQCRNVVRDANGQVQGKTSPKCPGVNAAATPAWQFLGTSFGVYSVAPKGVRPGSRARPDFSVLKRSM
jgi:hypothetical protein